MQPSTPPPPKREVLAALTIASTRIFVISFLIICNGMKHTSHSSDQSPCLIKYLLKCLIHCFQFFSALHRSCKYTAIKGKYICFPSILFYAIILLLSNRNPATGGGEPHGIYYFFLCLLHGWCSLPLHHQMVRRRQVRTALT